MFWTSNVNDIAFRQAKTELVLQIRELRIAINSKGFFQVNREFLFSVSLKQYTLYSYMCSISIQYLSRIQFNVLINFNLDGCSQLYVFSHFNTISLC